MYRIIAFLCMLVPFVFAEESSLSFSSLKAKELLENSVTGSRSSVSLTPMYAEMQVDSNYVLGPGDYLDLMLEENYLSVQIYPDGYVAIEECGAVEVGGKTFAEARRLILDMVSKKYKREYCFVQLASLKKFRVNAMGAVVQVGQHLIEPQTRLSYFLRQTGGLLSNANSEDIQVIRAKDTIHVNYNNLTMVGSFDDDIMLEQGDKIYVPFISMSDNVVLVFPGYRTSLLYQKGRTLQEYFDLAGGKRLHNFGYKAVAVREPGQNPRWINIEDMKTIEISPNTEVEFLVRDMLVYVGGAVNYIGRYPYNPSWHAIDYVAASGINPMVGTWNQIKVWRGSKPEALKLSVTEDAILPGDYIEVPRSHYDSFKDFTMFLASLLTVISSAFIIYVNYK